MSIIQIDFERFYYDFCKKTYISSTKYYLVIDYVDNVTLFLLKYVGLY